MSYSDFIFAAATKARDVSYDGVGDPPTHTEVGAYLEREWPRLEDLAKNEHYEVLECSDVLRAKCLMICASLYFVEDSSVQEDFDQLTYKDREYGGSWQRRGGPGAFFAAVRKWDRIEHQLKKTGDLGVAIETDRRAEGILDDLGDLRRYLVLWEAWRMSLESRHVAVRCDSCDPSFTCFSRPEDCRKR